MSPDDIRILSDLYDAEIATLDREISRFIEDLRRAGILDDAILIVTSDHGESLGEHGFLDHVFLIDRAVRYVPLVVRLPGGARGGEASDEVIRLQDLFPTILETCGLAIPEGLDAHSVFDDVPDRRARASLDAPTRLVYRAYDEKDGAFDLDAVLVDYRAVFDGRFHWINATPGRLQVYDIFSDPAETMPLPGLDGKSPFE
jgi:arylsulfatase A-like enzyme